MRIDTGPSTPAPQSAVVENSQRVQFADPIKANRCARKIVEAMEAAETLRDLDDYWRAEDAVIDALWSYNPDIYEALKQSLAENRGRILCGLESMERAKARHPAAADPLTPAPNTQNGKAGNITRTF